MGICDKCKWAKWQRTKNGRLHPSKDGRCTFEWIPPPLPAAFHFYNSLIPSGGFIERGDNRINQCPYFESAGEVKG